jgi:DNA-binding PadR family transcriptional regulator
VSATRLLVLGVVRMYGQAHGYQVRRELLGWSADKWANVAPGSIYHALKKMAGERLIEEVPGAAEAHGPDRVAYRLTADGEAEFQVLLEKMLSTPDGSAQDSYGLAAAITFLTALPRERAISLLLHRLTHLDGQHAAARSLLDNSADWGQPPHVSELYRLWLASLDSTLEWARSLVARLEAGEYTMADEGASAFGTAGSATEANQV